MAPPYQLRAQLPGMALLASLPLLATLPLLSAASALAAASPPAFPSSFSVAIAADATRNSTAARLDVNAEAFALQKTGGLSYFTANFCNASGMYAYVSAPSGCYYQRAGLAGANRIKAREQQRRIVGPVMQRDLQGFALGDGGCGIAQLFAKSLMQVMHDLRLPRQRCDGLCCAIAAAQQGFQRGFVLRQCHCLTFQLVEQRVECIGHAQWCLALEQKPEA